MCWLCCFLFGPLALHQYYCFKQQFIGRNIFELHYVCVGCCFSDDHKLHNQDTQSCMMLQYAEMKSNDLMETLLVTLPQGKAGSHVGLPRPENVGTVI